MHKNIIILTATQPKLDIKSSFVQMHHNQLKKYHPLIQRY